jgi:hypothetical protein
MAQGNVLIRLQFGDLEVQAIVADLDQPSWCARSGPWAWARQAFGNWPAQPA